MYWVVFVICFSYQNYWDTRLYNLAQVHLTIPIVCEAAQAVIVKLYTVLRIPRSMIPSYGSLKFPFLQSKALSSSLALKNSRAIVYALRTLHM